jgi:hypothetical protein
MALDSMPHVLDEFAAAENSFVVDLEIIGAG